MTKIKPMNDKILVRLSDEKKETTAIGLYIPESAQEITVEGQVEAVGPGYKNDAGDHIPVDVKVGDRVLFTKYGGTAIKIVNAEDTRNWEHLLLKEDDILAIVES